MVKINFEEKFPQNYLIQVACEVRFPAFLMLKEIVPKYQNKLREDYPNLGVSYPTTIQGLTGPPDDFHEYNFKTRDNKTQIKITVNSLSFISLEYDNFTSFYEEFKKVYDLFLNIFKIENYTRVGLRYTNEYPLISVDDPIPEVLHLFSTHLHENYIEKDLFLLNSHLRWKINEYNLASINNLLSKISGGKFFIFDYDAFYDQDSTKNEVENIINDLHKIIISEFHIQITDKFREILRSITTN